MSLLLPTLLTLGCLGTERRALSTLDHLVLLQVDPQSDASELQSFDWDEQIVLLQFRLESLERAQALAAELDCPLRQGRPIGVYYHREMPSWWDKPPPADAWSCTQRLEGLTRSLRVDPSPDPNDTSVLVRIDGVL